MKKILNIILLLATCTAWSQTIDPQVINSAGSHRVDATTGISITDNVGEPFTETLGPVSNIMITQGYLQPFVISPGFSVTLAKSDVTCSDKKDGSINIAIHSVYSQTMATYSWTPSLVCPGNNCHKLDSLNAGTYSVAIRITYTTTAGFVKQDSSFQTTTVTDVNGPCIVSIPSGFSPDGDNVNDTWIIKNITQFKPNKVSIFNRWGKEVYSEENYDNEGKVWTGIDSKTKAKLPSSTYFYIIDLGQGKLVKGWIELINNN